jgi:dTDP-4-amino-4,6-dideoxygalactose transaminase
MVRTAHREDLREFLGTRGIQTGIHYPVPIHLQEAYRELELGPGAFPNAEALARETLSLPMFPELRPEQLDAVVTGVRDFFERR